MRLPSAISRAVAFVAGLPAAVRRALLLTALLVGAVVVLALAKSRYDEARRAEGRREAGTQRLVETVKQVDSVFVHDTVARRPAIADYRTAAADLRSDPAPCVPKARVDSALAKADTALARDSAALESGIRRVAVRDTLIRVVTKPADSARLLPFVAVLYAPSDKTTSVRAGTTLRLAGRLAAIADVESTFGGGRLPSTTARVGGHWTF